MSSYYRLLSITPGDILNKIALLYSSSSQAKTYAMRSISSFSETAKEVLKTRWWKRHLVMIFTVSVGVNLKVIAKIASFNREFTLCIWHRRSSNCGEMFADSSRKFQVNVRFQVKVRFNLSNGQKKGQAQWIYICWLGWCCWAAKSLTRSQSGWRRKALPNKTLDNFKSFQSLLAGSQQRHGL